MQKFGADIGGVLHIITLDVTSSVEKKFSHGPTTQKPMILRLDGHHQGGAPVFFPKMRVQLHFQHQKEHFDTTSLPWTSLVA